MGSTEWKQNPFFPVNESFSEEINAMRLRCPTRQSKWWITVISRPNIISKEKNAIFLSKYWKKEKKTRVFGQANTDSYFTIVPNKFVRDVQKRLTPCSKLLWTLLLSVFFSVRLFLNWFPFPLNLAHDAFDIHLTRISDIRSYPHFGQCFQFTYIHVLCISMGMRKTDCDTVFHCAVVKFDACTKASTICRVTTIARSANVTRITCITWHESAQPPSTRLMALCVNT